MILLFRPDVRESGNGLSELVYNPALPASITPPAHEKLVPQAISQCDVNQ
jgi:hypothetical protein